MLRNEEERRERLLYPYLPVILREGFFCYIPAEQGLSVPVLFEALENAVYYIHVMSFQETHILLLEYNNTTKILMDYRTNGKGETEHFSYTYTKDQKYTLLVSAKKDFGQHKVILHVREETPTKDD